MIVFVNGVLDDRISINDRGFQFGDGLFETMRIIDGQPEDLSAHLLRMKKSCKRLSIEFPKNFQAEIEKLCNKNNGVLKIILTRGLGSAGLKINQKNKPNRVIKITDLSPDIRRHQQLGVAVKICKTRMSDNPATAGLKTLNWLPNVLAGLELTTDFYEGLMLNRYGQIIEGVSSNFFAISDGMLITPDLKECGLIGITRAKILKIAQNLAIKTEEKPIKMDDKFSECFITNSIIGLCPIIKIGQKSYQISDKIRQIQNKLLEK